MAQKKDKIFTDILYPGFTDCRYIGAAFRASDFRKGFTGMFFIFLIDWPMGGSFKRHCLQLFFPGAETGKGLGRGDADLFFSGDHSSAADYRRPDRYIYSWPGIRGFEVRIWNSSRTGILRRAFYGDCRRYDF